MNKENAFQNTTTSHGYFKEHYNKLKVIFTDKEVKEFAVQGNDEARVKYVKSIVPVEKRLAINVDVGGKNLEAAKLLKDKGNKEFGKGCNMEALKHYADAVLKVPFEEDTRDLAVILANRSAALYHSQQFEEAICDIDQALTLAYPKQLMYKVLERRAKCLLALKQHQEAFKEFRRTLQALDDAQLPTEKKLKLQTDVQIMLGVMSKPTTKQGHINAFLQGAPSHKGKEKSIEPKLSGARNKVFLSGSDKLGIAENEQVGRYGVAAEDVRAGDTLIIEKAFCSVLLAEYCRTNCTHCFKRTLVPHPCLHCCHVVFCSLECRKASEQYHRYECGLWETLHKSGASVTVLMALRVITQQPLDFFWQLRDMLKEPRENPPVKYSSSHYLSAYHLVCHDTQRKSEDFIERTVMALFLLDCLDRVGYFKDTATNELEEKKDFIGGLLLRHLQLMQFNAHEISELETLCVETIDKAEAKFIGGGLFPLLALLNHSCDPGVVRYFRSNTVVVRAVKPIREGQVVAENYGPIFTLVKREERRAKLRAQYWFHCDCVPCRENWPTFNEMDKKVLRFRCDARTESGERQSVCNNAVAVPTDTTEFMAKCLLCHQHTNILKGLKALQTTDAMFRQASADSSHGNYQAALHLYLEILHLLDDTMVPPFADYHTCQEAIRKCILSMGNRYLKDSW